LFLFDCFDFVGIFFGFFQIIIKNQECVCLVQE
jgi:hypothetical protein